MDTKLKSIKYRLGTKIVAAIVAWVCFIGSLGSGIFLFYHTEKRGSNSYYDTYDFQWQIGTLIHNVVERSTKLKDIDGTKYTDEIKDIDEAEHTSVDESTQEVPTQGWDTEEKYTDNKVEQGNYMTEKLRRLSTINNNLSKAVNFNYYIRELKTGDESYNTDLKLIQDNPNHIYIGVNEVPDYIGYHDDIQGMLINSPHELYILINDPLLPGDELYDEFVSYNEAKELMPYAIGALIGALILLILSFGYLIIVSGREEKGGEILLMGIDKVYNDIQSSFLLIVAGVSISIVANINFNHFNDGVILALIIFAIDVAIGMTYFFSMLRQLKKGVIIKNTLAYKFISKVLAFIRGCFNQKIFKGWLLGLMLLYAFINGLLFSFALNNRYDRFAFGTFLVIMFNVAALYFALKALKSLTVIMAGAKEISNGNLDYEINQSNISTAFSSFAQDIQSIQGGLKNAVNEAIKGERMKTDLITNVSHDLKTPLTSIINYVDLLKQENIENETAADYLNILDEKSDRLKQLIEDLIEASKASSGNLTLTTDQVDLGELVTQACGEYEEKIEESQLDLRISSSEEKTWIKADGKYMWRIIENMMSNALKYSMPHTRVYIDIKQNSEYGVLVMKNISANPLDIDPAQLTERFIRADESRTTEGSGLGLSIAQSLASIQGGKFDIEIDGDLFKVTVEIPLWVEIL